MTPFDVPGKEAISHNVFYTIKDRNYHLCYISFVVCKCFEFGQEQIFVMWEWVNYTQKNPFENIMVKGESV